MRLFIAAALFLAVCFPAEASHRHMHSGHRHHFAHHLGHGSGSHARMAHRRGRGKGARMAYRQRNPRAMRSGGGLVTVSTAAGPITVASYLAGRFQALIADFVAHGYKPRHVGCFAATGHVPHSRHHVGAACDFDQRGWGKTVPFMYRAHAIIARHGFRDGCSFADCGHVDDGQFVHYARRWRGSSFGG